MSHGACRPVGASVIGAQLNDAVDIDKMALRVRYDSMDLLQAPHTFSGVETAMWDLLGKAKSEPIYRLLNYKKAFKKTPYASQLFGQTPQETLAAAHAARAKGFRAAKFGWGPFGRDSCKVDADHLVAAREGLGADGILLIDAGQIWDEDVEAAIRRLPALEAANVVWLEEPFHASAFEAYRALAARSPRVRIAGGEGAHNVSMARHLIDYGRVGFVQVDCGRIGGIGPAKIVADYAARRGVTYVNHTFTSHLALSASLQPYAGLAADTICEYPFAPKKLAWDLSINHLTPDSAGEVSVPAAPGLGIDVNIAALQKYLVPVEIKIKGSSIYTSPALD
jgi:L-alanine-DL-glutamate epimerase-like enolase superfamily enzyme